MILLQFQIETPDDLHRLTRGGIRNARWHLFFQSLGGRLPVDIVALIAAIASIFGGGGIVTPDSNPKITVQSG
jgi:hypothetical protein